MMVPLKKKTHNLINKKTNAMIFLCRHLHEDLKNEHLTISNQAFYVEQFK